MICENCKKQKASAYFNTKRVCEDCFFKLSNMKRDKKIYECSICKKRFTSGRKLSIPFCSRKCKNKAKRRLNREEDGLNKQYKAFCKEVKA